MNTKKKNSVQECIVHDGWWLTTRRTDLQTLTNQTVTNQTSNQHSLMNGIIDGQVVKAKKVMKAKKNGENDEEENGLKITTAAEEEEESQMLVRTKRSIVKENETEDKEPDLQMCRQIDPFFAGIQSKYPVSLCL